MTGANQHQPRTKPAPYSHKARKQLSKDAPVTSAVPHRNARQNLTLHDWITVFAYIDKHPHASQEEIVEHFATKPDASLHFTQSTLSRKLKTRSQMEQRIHDNPNALSGKRPRIVTRPDIEKALVKWVQQMEQRNEQITGTMLQEK